MADFLPPFGEEAPLRRFPTEQEQALGLLCGAAARELFIGLFNRIEAELGEVITFAGLTPTNGDLAQVRKAIELMIASATGGGATADYLLISQARARLPIFPDVQTADGKCGVTAQGGGVIRMPASVTFMHRGIVPVTSVQTDFNTSASKIYHLRWYAPGVGRAQPLATYPNGRWYLEDLADTTTYNPGSVAEGNVMFDSSYDNMLVARITTNASNVAAIDNLANKINLQYTQGVSGFGTQWSSGGSNDGVLFDGNVSYWWARAPRVVVATGYAATGGGGLVNGFCNYISNQVQNRYGASARVSTDYQSDLSGQSLNGYLLFQAIG